MTDGQTDRQAESLYLRRASAWLTHVQRQISSQVATNFPHVWCLSYLLNVCRNDKNFNLKNEFCNWTNAVTEFWLGCDVRVTSKTIQNRPRASTLPKIKPIWFRRDAKRCDAKCRIRCDFWRVDPKPYHYDCYDIPRSFSIPSLNHSCFVRSCKLQNSLKFANFPPNV